MAHFAELDENNVVKRVVVVKDKDCCDANGVEKEHIGTAHCEWLLGGRWVQTSYNRKFRKRYAGVGMVYNEEADAFMPPKPFPSWVVNVEAGTWEAPTPMPEEGNWEWNEETISWVEVL